MPISGERSQALKKQHKRLDTVFPQAPPCGDGHCSFCNEAWMGIAQSLGLSQRQVEIARYVMAGQKDKEIAERLDVSFSTIQTHMGRMHERLDIKSRVALVTRIAGAYDTWRLKHNPPTGCPYYSRLDLLFQCDRIRTVLPPPPEQTEKPVEGRLTSSCLNDRENQQR